MPAQFKLQNDRVVLSLTAEQVKALPAIVKKVRLLSDWLIGRESLIQ